MTRALICIAAYHAVGVVYDAQHVTHGWSMYLGGIVVGWYLFGASA